MNFSDKSSDGGIFDENRKKLIMGIVGAGVITAFIASYDTTYQEIGMNEFLA